MGNIQDSLTLLTFLLEVAVLLYCEFKAWKSLYTPITFLILPYVVILALTIVISGRYGFVEFYYPSMMLWIVGLLIFSIPSIVLAYLMQCSGHSLWRETGEYPQGECMEQSGSGKRRVLCGQFLLGNCWQVKHWTSCTPPPPHTHTHHTHIHTEQCAVF